MRVRVGTAPVSWGVMEIEGWGGEKSYKEVLDEMIRAGFEGTELGPYGFYPTDPDRLSAELQSRGLTLTSAFVGIKLGDPTQFQDGLATVTRVGKLLAALGGKLIVLADSLDQKRMAIAGRVSTEEGHALSEKEWTNVARACEEIACSCLEMGLETVFHHHVGTYVETPQEISRLCALTDPDLVGLCLDTGHYLYGGGDSVEAFEQFGRRIRYVHFKDVNPEVLNTIRNERLGFLEGLRRGVFCPLGEGCVDFKRIVREMEKIGYEGWITYELDADVSKGTDLRGRTPLDNASSSRRYLKEVIGI